jgi:hypothetical protein
MNMWKWLQGKKTYFGAGLIAAAAIAGFWYGQIDATQLAAGLGMALATIGIGHKFDRQIATLVELLEEAKAKKEIPAETK